MTVFLKTHTYFLALSTKKPKSNDNLVAMSTPRAQFVVQKLLYTKMKKDSLEEWRIPDFFFKIGLFLFLQIIWMIILLASDEFRCLNDLQQYTDVTLSKTL